MVGPEQQPSGEHFASLSVVISGRRDPTGQPAERE
jgi:hypothetical protein